jgi:hypothetical protein
MRLVANKDSGCDGLLRRAFEILSTSDKQRLFVKWLALSPYSSDFSKWLMKSIGLASGVGKTWGWIASCFIF